MLSVLLAADPRTDQEIAKLAGIDRTTLSKIRTGDRAPTEEQVRSLAKVLGVHPNVLTAQIPREEIIGQIERMTEEKARGSAPTPIQPVTSPVRLLPDYTLAEDHGLVAIYGIHEAPDRIDIPIWPEDVAASDLDSLDPKDQPKAWIPAEFEKLYGAKPRAIGVVGRSMVLAGIDPGDVLIVRQSTSSKDGQIVIFQQGDGMTLKLRKGDMAVPMSDDPKYQPIKIRNAKLQGVVFGIHKRPKQA